MDERRCELVTLAAARALRRTYCRLAHGTVLRDTFCTADPETFATVELQRSDKAAAVVAWPG